MKTTVKIIALLLCAITMATVLGSCSKEDVYQSNISGSWQVTHFYGSFTGIESDYEDTWDESYENGKTWFFMYYGDGEYLHADGEYLLSTNSYGHDAPGDGLSFLERTILGFHEGGYNYDIICAISGDSLVFPGLYWYLSDFSARIIELTKTTMILHFDCIYCRDACYKNKYDATIEFKKVK